MADFVFSQSDPWWPYCESDWAQFRKETMFTQIQYKTKISKENIELF
jgi:hypothetical protein